MLEQIRAELAPTGVLRAAINLSNFLLVTGRSSNGDPEGISPDMAIALAQKLDLPVKFVPFDTPGQVADAALEDIWDIANIGAEPERSKTISFTDAYVEISATYLLPETSKIKTIQEVDREGVRIAVYGRAAYGLWLSENIRHATLLKADSHAQAFEWFVSDKLDVLAGLAPGLVKDLDRLPGSRLVDGQFSAVQQAIGTKPERALSIAFLREFVAQSKASGFVADLIDKHGVKGSLNVAPGTPSSS